jgi:hypothetical protein
LWALVIREFRNLAILGEGGLEPWHEVVLNRELTQPLDSGNSKEHIQGREGTEGKGRREKDRGEGTEGKGRKWVARSKGWGITFYFLRRYLPLVW